MQRTAVQAVRRACPTGYSFDGKNVVAYSSSPGGFVLSFAAIVSFNRHFVALKPPKG